MPIYDDGRGSSEARDRPPRDERAGNERRDAERRPADAGSRNQKGQPGREPEGGIGRRGGDPDRPRRPRPADQAERSVAPAARNRLPALEAARAGLRQLAMVTGLEPQGVVSLLPDENGWRIGIEIVEDRRIPSSTDVLGLYEATVDDDGELTGYSRKRRYPRSQSDAGGTIG
jgi:hypothetical protein